MYKYFNTSVKDSTTYVSSWESKGLSNEKNSSIITPTITHKISETNSSFHVK